MSDHTLGVVAKVGVAMQYGGATAAVYFGKFTINELAAIAGVIVGVIGLIANVGISIWFKNRHLKLMEERNRRGQVPFNDFAED